VDLHQQIATGSCPQHFIDTGFHVQLRRQHARRAVTRGQGEALGDMLGGFGPAQLVPVVVRQQGRVRADLAEIMAQGHPDAQGIARHRIHHVHQMCHHRT